MNATKHMVECHCILPQYRDRKKPVYHRFVVFSEIEIESDTVVPSFAQCNNCGTVHKIRDICKSEIVTGKEESAAVEQIKDVAMSLPNSLVELFESYNVELPDYMLARHIMQYDQWGTTIVLAQEKDGEATTGKLLRFIGPEKFRVEPFSRQDYI